ncbi:hypothetical protein AUK40_06685 [Candidatus Wirthbacteria bacterium CG2_30_54_11]|uniref:S1 motif domain-containing protein n=1 Tax=Candidatus Wirthbacteria bacterium CG2_30_54_11 TaxID=1817892 RepID=A0A1J5IC95_9BACT|nr:MAG: hypothetical protein AUK40_06685 [Candidatus Wirthbacteria bacterium CG2_30_54_11]
MSNPQSAKEVQKEPVAERYQLFTELLEQMTTNNAPSVGDVVEGTVVALSKGEALVDFGAKSEGVIQGRELVDLTSDDPLAVGSSILAIVLFSEDEEGRAILSVRRARAEKKWREMKDKFDNKTAVDVVVVQPNKGGLIVNAEGLQGFVPISQLGPAHYPSKIAKGPGFSDAAIAYLTQFVGAEFQTEIIEFERETNRLILSERTYLQHTKGFRPQEELDFKVGDTVKGKVVAIKDFGIFVDLGSASGLVHISEMSWDRVNHPGDLVKIGEDVSVKVIGIEEGARRVSLSMKQLSENPWVKVAERYSIGAVVKGKVTKIVDYGAFVQLEPGFDGLVHISELSSFHVKDPADVLQEGQEADFKIILLDKDGQRLGLSFKQANPEPLTPSAGTPTVEKKHTAKAEEPTSAVPTPEQEPTPVVENAPAVEAEKIEAAPEKAVQAEAPVVPEEPAVDKGEAVQSLTELDGVGPAVAEKLYDAGYQTVEKISSSTISELSLIPGIRMATAEKIQKSAALKASDATKE